MKPRVIHVAVAVAVAGCGVSDANFPDSTDGGSGSACAVSLGVAPVEPVAGSTVEVSALVTGAAGVLGYTWRILFDGAPVPFLPQSNGAVIDFSAGTPGVYTVSVDVAGSSPPCAAASTPINVRAPGAVSEFVRLRVVAPRSTAIPPFEELIQIKGGADADLGIYNIRSGVLVSTMVMDPSGGVPAYLQFSPSGAPDAIVEAFATASGVADVQLVLQPYSVVVVPSVATSAPRRITAWSAGQVLHVDAGTMVAGTVRDPANAPLAGATVQLTSNGVPSTLATTGSDGSFSLLAVPSGAVTVEVVPPVSSGLPRLSATSLTFDLGQPLQIRYAANVALTSLTGMTVQRLGAPVPGARLTMVGSLAAIGMVTAGTSMVATGDVRIAATADGAGKLPTTRVPSAALSAVVEVAPGDLAVVPLDTSAGAPTRLDVPPLQLITTAAVGAQMTGLPDVILELVPTGPLAVISAPTLRVTSAASGVIAAMLPAGGRYQLRFQDPLRRRGPLIVADRLITTIASSYQLPPAVQLQGALRRDGLQALPNASVQILCDGCSGLERTRPLVEVSSDAAGRFTLAVPDPGTR